jgi:integrase
MATMRMASLWKDPRTGVWTLRRRIPQRYRAVADQRGETLKLSSGTADRKLAEKALPGLLQRWADLEAQWERRLNVVALTPDKAREIAAGWAGWIAGGAKLETAGVSFSFFEPLTWAVMPEANAKAWERVDHHAGEALHLAGISVTPETWTVLTDVMFDVVFSAYIQKDEDEQRVRRPDLFVGPLAQTRQRLPAVADAPPISDNSTPVVSLRGLFDAWKATAVVKPRTVTETDYAVKALAAFVGHDDAAKVTRPELARWRDAMLADGCTNNTWNNRLSMLRQVLAFATSEGQIKTNPADGLRLRKSRQQSPLPYTDDDAAKILLAARQETRPSLRWSHWVMAFSGMRAGEVLQLLGGDVRQEGDLWCIDVNEATEGKSVKTGHRRIVPIHPALIREGFVAFAQTIATDAPLFPDKKVDPHGNRGGRAWQVIGRWVRETVRFTDPLKAPDHSWRHRMEDELRAVEVPEDARDAILGHTRKTTGRQYGVRGEALTRLHRYLSLVPVPAGVARPAGM